MTEAFPLQRRITTEGAARLTPAGQDEEGE